MSFSTLNLGPAILKAIEEAGYTEPTPIQAAAIPQILAGDDLIGIAQTGTGKTAAFVLPILALLSGAQPAAGRRGPQVLVLAPTRELVAQIEENVRAYARHLPLRMATIYGGVGERPQIEALRTAVDLVIACPGRLLDLMQRKLGFWNDLRFLVLDEADRMLDMGFIPSIRQIVKRLPQKRQTLLFSATLSHEIESLTREFLQSPKTVQIGRRSNPAETVTQFVYEVPQHLKPALLTHLLAEPAFDTVLVFARTKHGADRIARRLEQDGIRTATIHSNRSQGQRLRALKDFKAGAVRVLVATDIAARGIDVDGISHVVNYDFPMHSEDYVHRIGRTGRAHAVGDAISFITPEDYSPLRSLERFIGRGIVRKKAEGFDYAARAQPRSDSRQPRQDAGPRGPQRHRPDGSSGRPQQQQRKSPNDWKPPGDGVKPEAGSRRSSPGGQRSGSWKPRRR
jgi:ATP-dependent RNA helicase RhlE